MKAIVLLANGFEEVEGITQIDFLRRAGVEVTSVSIHETKRIIGQSMITVDTDALLCNINSKEYDMVILPGGLEGMKNLKDNAQVIALIKTYCEEKKWIAAICAAPSILGELGMLQNKTYTCYPGFEKLSFGGKFVSEKVIQDGHIITSKGPGTSHDFAVKLIEVLCGHEKASEIAKQTQI